MKKEIFISDAKEMIKERFKLGKPASGRFDMSDAIIGESVYEVPEPKELMGCLVEMDCIYNGYEEKEETLEVEWNNEIARVLPTDGTVCSTSILKETETNDSVKLGDRLSIISIKTCENVYVAVTIIREAEKKIFDQIFGLYGRAAAIRNFYGWFKDAEGKQDSIINLREGKKYPRYEASSDIQFNNKWEQILKYNLCRENYPLETQRAISTMLRNTNPAKHKTEQRLNYLSRINPEYKDRVEISESELRKISR